MGRLLLFLFVALMLWWLLKGLFRTRDDDNAPASRSTRGEDMVACARCGVNLPRSDAREEAGRYYCVNNPHCPPSA